MRCSFVLAVALLLGAAAPPSGAAPRARGWEYRVRLDAELKTMDVEICFRRFLPRRLVLSDGASLAAFDFPARANAPRLEVRGDAVVPRGLGDSGCVRYRVDLDRLRSRGWRGGVSRVGRDLLAPPGLLFLRPALWPGDVDVGVTFDLPDGFRPAVPWPRDAGGERYRADRYALQLEGLMAIGRFPADDLRVAGTVIDIAVLDAPHRATRAGIRAWLRAAALAVADLYGRFPMPHVTALVQPVPSGRPAVVFGQAMRAGGGHVHLLLSSRAQDENLPGEWVAIHEMTHLGMPWTYDTEAWMQEGFVTYYQEVLRARAGFLTEQGGWQQLHEGFGRGRRSGGTRSLESESRDMMRNHTFHRVYWGGAAIALQIDLELRRRSGGRRSLDDVMRMLHANFGGTRAPHHGVDLLRAVDRWLGQRLCTVVADTCLQSNAFPSLDAVYAALGLGVEGKRIVYLDGAPQAAERARIMRPAGR